jgi:hypothetical protein
MAHSAWWVGLLQVVLLFAALVFTGRSAPDVPAAEGLSRGARWTAARRQHPWQYGAAVLCTVAAAACGFLYYL